jgi:hypothetical protein
MLLSRWEVTSRRVCHVRTSLSGTIPEKRGKAGKRERAREHSVGGDGRRVSDFLFQWLPRSRDLC